jgi:isovaleryl-CoA dehydrogenase
VQFGLTDDELALRDATREIVRREVAPVADQMDREDRFPREVFVRLGENGLLAPTLPTDVGGLGLSYRAQALILEEIARQSPALALSVGAHSNLFADNVARNATAEQRRRFLPEVAAGREVGALALTEPDAGSDAVSIRTRASRHGDEYVLNGTKQFITNGPVASVLLVYAKTSPEHGHRGISAFLLRSNAPGFTVSRSLDKMGMRGSPTGELVLHNVRVPAEDRLGAENEGVRIMMGGLNVERAVLAAIPVGILEECLARSVDYARRREQFGQPIGRFQLIQEKLADMYTDLAASRLLLLSALEGVARDPTHRAASAAALTFASEASTRAALQAVQIHGGSGYMRDLPLERFARDAKLLEIGAGTSEIRRLLIARELLGEGFESERPAPAASRTPPGQVV